MTHIARLLAVLICVVQYAHADEVLRADYRPRPPDMYKDEETGKLSGPLVEILEEAAKSVGCRIVWREDATFARSLANLKTGETDIVPRLILTNERKEYAEFLGPIAVDKKDISFLVKKGKEGLIQDYEDLGKIKIGVKRGTVYFDRFDRDSKLKANKVESIDDSNMAKMFIAGRFDAMIVLDKDPIEKALKDEKYSNYAYAEYVYSKRVENYYGFSKKSPNIGIAPKLQDALVNMVTAGRIRTLYEKHDLGNQK